MKTMMAAAAKRLRALLVLAGLVAAAPSIVSATAPGPGDAVNLIYLHGFVRIRQKQFRRCDGSALARVEYRLTIEDTIQFLFYTRMNLPVQFTVFLTEEIASDESCAQMSCHGIHKVGSAQSQQPFFQILRSNRHMSSPRLDSVSQETPKWLSLAS